MNGGIPQTDIASSSDEQRYAGEPSVERTLYESPTEEGCCDTSTRHGLGQQIL